MSTALIYVLVGLASVVIGLVLGMYIQKLKIKSNESVWKEREVQMNNTISSLNKKIMNSDEEKRQLQSEKESQSNEIVRYQADLENLQQKHREQKGELAKLQDKFTKDFEILANKILEDKSKKFTKKNQENLENILNPLKEKIKEFEGKVEKTHKESIDYHAALRQQIVGLKELNNQMSKEANNLTKALKGDSKMQGNWGELVLERVLEKSGLERDREYSVQQSFTREDRSRVMPDVIIHLPDGKKMIVDSKVSLTDYERYTNAEEADKPGYLKDHITSLRKHVSQLSAKRYEDLYAMESPDFVLMFVPIEPAFAIAINEDSSLYNKAFEQNIVIVTPSTLLATLRTIDSMWSNEKQQRNAMEIARQAGALYDKFVGFIDDLKEVGKKMDDAKGEYKNAMNKLFEGRGNIVTSIEKLKKLGAKAKKSLPEPILKRAENVEEDSNPTLEL
ncbi:MAG: DNA recombination protein RmuC [Bacteroidota bacterium]